MNQAEKMSLRAFTKRRCDRAFYTWNFIQPTAIIIRNGWARARSFFPSSSSSLMVCRFYAGSFPLWATHNMYTTLTLYDLCSALLWHYTKHHTHAHPEYWLLSSQLFWRCIANNNSSSCSIGDDGGSVRAVGQKLGFRWRKWKLLGWKLF